MLRNNIESEIDSVYEESSLTGGADVKEDAYRKIHISDTQLSYIFVLVTVKKYLERYIYSQPIFFFATCCVLLK